MAEPSGSDIFLGTTLGSDPLREIKEPDTFSAAATSQPPAPATPGEAGGLEEVLALTECWP